MKSIMTALGLMFICSGCVISDYGSGNTLEVTNSIRGTYLVPYVNGGPFRMSDDRSVTPTPVRIPHPGILKMDLGYGASGNTVDVQVWVYDAKTHEHLGNAHHPVSFPVQYYDNYGGGYGSYQTYYHNEIWDVRSYDPPAPAYPYSAPAAPPYHR